MQTINNTAHQRLYDKWQTFKTIPSLEQSFLKMESAFYDILALARLQESSLNTERLLAQLTRLKNEKFQLTQKVYAKARQRQLFICQFKTALNKELAAYFKAVKSKKKLEETVYAV